MAKQHSAMFFCQGFQRYFWIVLEFVALFQTGYVHPDEFFQNPEITGGDIFNVTHFRAWEFMPVNSLRTVAIPYLTTGILFFLTRLISFATQVTVPAYLLIVISRIFFCILRILLGWFLMELRTDVRESSRSLALCFRTSYLTVIFLPRTFSNSIETLLFAMLLYLALKSKEQRKVTESTSAALVGVVSAVGIFNRPTFLAFGLVPWLFILSTFQIRHLLRGVFAGFVTCAVLVGVDSLYFGKLVVTPFRFFLYNVNPKNNEAHGLHPRHFHLFVSMPQLFGPLLLALVLPSVRRALASHKFLLATVAIPLFLISMIPHQEPRFLLPLLVPIFVLLGGFVWNNRLLRVSWLFFNLSAGLFFGFIHQGGVIPSLSSVRQVLESQPDAHVAYYKTYIPPQYPLLLPRDQSARFVNLGMSDHVGIQNVTQHLENKTLEDRVFLVTPATIDVLGINMPGRSAVLWKTFCPHWSFEAQPDYASLWERPEQLCLNMWRLDASDEGPYAVR